MSLRQVGICWIEQCILRLIQFDSSLQLDKLADRVRELVAKPMDPRQMCLVINQVLFHEFGYRGAGKNFEDPDNSFLHCVLEHKEGCPLPCL